MTPTLERLATALADRYRIERELGAGGMATVFLAEDLRHHRNVAIKVLKPDLAAVLGAERFVQEITTTAQLQHPHILPLFDSGSAGGFLFYVMPYIEGETLRDQLNRETQLGIEQAVRITTEVADALDYAHRHGVIHRDIKPENILLHDGRPMVADFGIALAVSAAAGGRMTETGLSLGTPHYMSPEQATAEKELSARSDIYSLGSVLYEMLTGNPPHVGASAQQIIMKIVTEEAAPVTTLRRAVPSNVALAVARSLQKLPADRFGSAAQFRDALLNPGYGAELTDGQRASAGIALAGRRLGLGAAAALLLAGLAAGALLTKTLWPGATRTVTAARVMLDFPVDQQPYLPTVPWPILAQTPDGSGFVYTGPGTTGRSQFWLRPWDRLDGARITQTREEGCCLVYSPGGDSVAYLTAPHLLRVVPLSGGVPTVVADSGLTSVTDFGGGVDWGPDGRLYVSGLAGLLRLPAGGGPLELVAPLDSARGDLRYLWPAALPGARGAVVAVVPREGTNDPERIAIGVADFQTGQVRIILQGIRAFYAPTGHLLVVKGSGALVAVPFDPGSLRLGGRERELGDTVAVDQTVVNVSLSPTGTLVYIKSTVRAYETVWVDREGKAQVIAPDLSDVQLDSPTLSPDGSQLALTMAGADGQQHIWLKPLNGAPKVRLTFDGDNFRSAWRPTGTGVVSFLTDRDRRGAPGDLFETDARGAGRHRRIEYGDERALGGHGWSPNGRWLLIRTDDQAAGNADILALRPGVDSVARPLVATPAEEMGQELSPDGRWLAYSSNETGRREIHVRPFPDAEEARYQVSTTGGITPLWSRDGRELFYLDPELNLVAVPVVPGGSFQTGQPRVLFPAARYQSNPFRRQYDVMPDGRFVMIRGENDEGIHVVAVFGFLEELERRMAAP